MEEIESCNLLIYATQHIDYHRFFGKRIKIQQKAAWLAQLGERRSAEREVGRTNT